MPFSLPSDILETCDGMMYCLALWANDVTNGFFWVMAILAFAVVLFMATQRFGTPRAFGFASVAAMLASIWMAILELMPWWIASAFILTGVLGFAVMILNER